MAEGLLRHLAGDRFDSLSAGAAPTGYVHPGAIAAMNELGIDLTGHSSKHIREFLPENGTPPDVVVSVCDSASQACPTFPGSVERRHWPFDDPAHATGTDEEQARVFRRVRDEIRTRLEKAFEDGELGA